MACVMVNFGKSINHTCLVLPNTSTQPSGHLFEVFAYDVTGVSVSPRCSLVKVKSKYS